VIFKDLIKQKIKMKPELKKLKVVCKVKNKIIVYWKLKWTVKLQRLKAKIRYFKNLLKIRLLRFLEFIQISLVINFL